MKWVLFFFIIHPNLTMACLPNEIHVREQWIESYTKLDGTRVAAHSRSEHCRELTGQSYFQDSFRNELRNFTGKIKPWKNIEKELLRKELEKLPVWLKRYEIATFLRSSAHQGNPKNPALTYPDSKTVILFDSFFSSSEKRSILIHEMSHIAAWDVDPVKLKEFFLSNGWVYVPGQPPKPPVKVIIPDSVNSPSEDFSNAVETYYVNPKKLKDFNSESFSIVEKIINSMEKQ